MFRCNIDTEMVNTGTKDKPFLSAKVEVREYTCGPIRYCTIRTEKTMLNIGSTEGGKPWFVKIYDLIQVKVFGIRIRYKEQSWKYNKL